jgi:hypothetical protein
MMASHFHFHSSGNLPEYQSFSALLIKLALYAWFWGYNIEQTQKKKQKQKL